MLFNFVYIIDVYINFETLHNVIQKFLKHMKKGSKL